MCSPVIFFEIFQDTFFIEHLKEIASEFIFESLLIPGKFLEIW